MSSAIAAIQQDAYANLSDRTICRPRTSAAVIVLCDLLALALAAVCGLLTQLLMQKMGAPHADWRCWPLLGLFQLAYAGFRLYPGISLQPVSELRRATSATLMMYVVVAASALFLQGATRGGQIAFAVSCTSLLVLIPFLRSCVRHIFAQLPWWGYPVAVLGTAETAAPVIQKLQFHKEVGFKPMAVVCSDPIHGTIHGVTAVDAANAGSVLPRLGIRHALVLATGMDQDAMKEAFGSALGSFPYLFVVHDLGDLSSLRVEVRELCRMVSFEVREPLLMRWPPIAKRLIDLLVAGVCLIFLLPLIFVVVALIKLESPGPAFFRHRRIGRNGKTFNLVKFRSMIVDGDRALREHFQLVPEAEAEWRENQKLARDPRITCMGRFLRKSSMDELPQLWNVLKGDMSLVGPRPIIEEEISRYGNHFATYKRVMPGLTGLWQVSGRSCVSYQRRVELDSYYVHNWSVWLDIYLLARTTVVIVSGHGAV